jgi:hypothetical protein
VAEYTAHDTQQTVDNSGVVKCGWAQSFGGESHISLGLIISKTTVLSLKIYIELVFLPYKNYSNFVEVINI